MTARTEAKSPGIRLMQRRSNLFILTCCLALRPLMGGWQAARRDYGLRGIEHFAGARASPLPKLRPPTPIRSIPSMARSLARSDALPGRHYSIRLMRVPRGGRWGYLLDLRASSPVCPRRGVNGDPTARLGRPRSALERAAQLQFPADPGMSIPNIPLKSTARQCDFVMQRTGSSNSFLREPQTLRQPRCVAWPFLATCMTQL